MSQDLNLAQNMKHLLKRLNPNATWTNPAKGIFSGRILRLQDDEEVVRAPQHSGGRLMIFDRDLSKYGGGLTSGKLT